MDMKTLLHLRFACFDVNAHRNPPWRRAVVSEWLHVAPLPSPQFPVWKSWLGSEAFWEKWSMSAFVRALIRSPALLAQVNLIPSGINNDGTSVCGPMRSSRWKSCKELTRDIAWGSFYQNEDPRPRPGLRSPRKASWAKTHSDLSLGGFDGLYYVQLNAH